MVSAEPQPNLTSDRVEKTLWELLPRSDWEIIGPVCWKGSSKPLVLLDLVMASVVVLVPQLVPLLWLQVRLGEQVYWG